MISPNFIIKKDKDHDVFVLFNRTFLLDVVRAISFWHNFRRLDDDEKINFSILNACNWKILYIFALDIKKGE